MKTLPNAKMNKLINIFFILQCVLIHFNQSQQIIQLHALIRHGERTPTEAYPNDIYLSWPEGWGQLTNRGKLESYILGQKFREQYKDFIPVPYYSNEVIVNSSYSERCRNTAQVFCAGLFPPKDEQVWNPDLLWQPIPVNYLPRSQDHWIAMKSKCDKYDKMFDEIQQSEKVLNIIEENQELFKYLTIHTGSNITTIEDVEMLYNTLDIEQQHNFTLPVWLNETMMATMRQLAALNLALYSETEYMKRMKGGMFLQSVFASMNKGLENKTAKKVFLYFAHDLSIVHVLRTLNFIDTLKPGFGAYVNFELYSNGRIKIIYSHSSKGPVEIEKEFDLDELKTNLTSVLPIDFDAECQLSSKII